MLLPQALKNYSAILGFPESETMNRIFEILYGDNEDTLKLVAALPGTPETIAQKTGISENRVRELCAVLVKRGAIGSKLKDPDLYRLFTNMIELRDSTVLDPDCPQELFELWETILTKEFPKLIPIAKQMKIDPITRIMPIEESVESQNTILDADSARKIFEDADLITVLPCACRLQADKVGRRTNSCPAPEEAVCMQTNGFARAVLKRNIGEQITREDALRRVKLAEDAGLMHMVRNNIKKDMFMCNCCSCCCAGLYLIRELDYSQGISPSRFRVKLDKEACSGCGVCVDRCQTGAITLEDTAVINFDLCFGCGNCAVKCPEDALTLEEIRPIEHIRVK